MTSEFLDELEMGEKMVSAKDILRKEIEKESPVGIYVCTPDGKLMESNEAGLRLLDLSEGEPFGFNLFERIGVSEEAFQRLKHGQEFRFRFEPNDRDKSRRLEVQIKPIDEGHHYYLVRMSDAATSEEKWALRQREGVWRNFVENIDEALYFQEIGGELHHLNKTSETISGYTREEIRADPQLWRNVIHPDDLEMYEAFFAQHPTGTPRFEAEYRLRKKSGEWRWMHSKMIAARDDDGKIVGYYCIDRDITEQKQSERRRNSIQAHLFLLSEINDLSNQGKSIDEITRMACDGLQKSYNLRFCVLALKHGQPGQERVIFKYININPYILGIAEKIVGVKLGEVDIRLSGDNIYSQFYQEKKAREFTDEADLVVLVRDLIPRGRKVSDKMIERTLRITNTRYIFVLPLFVHGKAIGHIAMVRSDPLTQEEKESINVVVDKISLIFHRMQFEEHIQHCLKEKDVLLREIHHRVKNSLQIIISLLNLQIRNIKNPDVLKPLKESRNRIRSMALVHEKLYQSTGISHIDFQEYVETISKELYHAYADPKHSVDLRLELSPVFLSIDQAIPCGLLINELITNAFKYAFPPGWKEKREIRISMAERPENCIQLSVADNGKGILKEVNLESSETLGFQLVSLLKTQLDAKMKIKREKGICWEIEFTKIGFDF